MADVPKPQGMFRKVLRVILAAAFAVGQRPAGIAYGYHLDSKFIDASGKGTRVEGRPCNATFAKQGMDRKH